MRRGDLVVVSLKDDYGKPRPALIVQSDLFDEHPSVTLMPVTSELRDTPLFRFRVEPDGSNGLAKPSQVMIDKIQTVPRDHLGQPIGRLEDSKMTEVNRLMALFLGLG
ncbi:MAG TPA: type II toxin-antitoxin system PemK/MazF family toxin [Wenzhouxiangellaceae bacterium]|nr:type II toxin-antitoxin system PemK/MazF family toxin [Wenzhouxiangellaceae bacterium]